MRRFPPKLKCGAICLSLPWSSTQVKSRRGISKSLAGPASLQWDFTPACSPLRQCRLRPADQVVVAVAAAFEVEHARGEELVAPRGADVVVVLQGGRAELVVVRIAALGED